MFGKQIYALAPEKVNSITNGDLMLTTLKLGETKEAGTCPPID